MVYKSINPQQKNSNGQHLHEADHTQGFLVCFEAKSAVYVCLRLASNSQSFYSSLLSARVILKYLEFTN